MNKKIIKIEQTAYEVVCEWCGRKFITTSDTAKFCKPSCRVMAYQKRRQGQTHK
jgi:hypothetical protein